MNTKLTLKHGLRIVCALTAVIALANCSGRRSEQHRIEGDTYYKLGKYEEAERSYNKAVTADPENALAFSGLGQAHLVQTELDEALESLEKAISLDPQLEKPHVLAVQLLLLQKQVDKAEAIASAQASIDEA